MNEKRTLLRHFLATLAYRTQKALKDAPERFADFRVSPGVRTPHQLIFHMTNVLSYARLSFTREKEWRSDQKGTFQEEIDRFYEILHDLGQHIEQGKPLFDMTPERMLQGPFADAMTHVGQLAMLRRLCGQPIPPENFSMAEIHAENLSQNQPDSLSPHNEWYDAEGHPQ